VTAERYVLLGLRLGRHVDGLVDAYIGPEELAARVAAEEVTPILELVEEADALVGATEDGWLRDQLGGLRAYAGVLAGEPISYADEVERCYGVRPVRVADDVYTEAHEQLDRLLPGDGSLAERRLAWKQRHAVPVERLVPALRDVVSDLRTRAGDIFGLPHGEGLTIDEVRDEPWWAFNYYLGNLTSRVVVNVDVPTSGPDLVHLAAHEAYPGHHLEHAWKEQLLMRGRDLLEESIFLVPTGQALVSEGIAETGVDLLLDEAARAEVQALLEAHGAGYDAEAAHELGAAFETLRTAGLDAALMIHEEGRSIEEAQAYVQRWGLRTSEQAAHEISFVTDPTWRAYAITYSAGRDLCRGYLGGDPARFRTLLTEQVRVRDLLAACA
jgi:hypothetical protein